MLARVRSLVVLGALMFAGCGPESAATDAGGGSSGSSGAATDSGAPTSSSGQGTSSASTTSGDASSGTTSSVLCLDWEAPDPGEAFPAALTCGLAELCAGAGALQFTVDGGSLTMPDAVSTDDIQRARCMASALRDRTPGVLRFTVPLSLGSDDHELEILGDDAIRRHAYQNDFNFEKSVRVRPLLPPADYAACAEGTAKQVYLCLVAGFVDACTGGAPRCP